MTERPALRNYSGANHSAKASQLRCFESFPLCGRQRKPPTLMVRVPSLRRFFFHFSHTSNFTPGLPTDTCSFIVAETHFVRRPCWRPFMTTQSLGGANDKQDEHSKQ